MDILIWTGVFIVALTVLLKSCDFFIDASEKLGRKFGLSEFIIGVTIVAMGTSLPELASSVVAMFKGESSIVIGNALGSNVTNICLVFGLIIFVGKDIVLKRDLTKVDLPLLLFSAVLSYFFLYDGNLSILEAIILLCALLVFLIYTATSSNDGVNEDETDPVDKDTNVLLQAGIIAISILGIYFSAEYTVTSIQKLSQFIGIESGVVALTLVALGTSLPEVIVSIKATRQGKADLAIGNIIGSNIFNTYAVIAIPRLLGMGELEILPEVTGFTLPLLLAVAILFFLSCVSKHLNRWVGVMFLLMYIVFLTGLF